MSAECDRSQELPGRRTLTLPGATRQGRIWRMLALGAGIFALAFLFANVEIQVEGAAGWAANLPTWRIDQHPLLDLFMGGKSLTGYHLWVFTFMAAVFHLPLLVTWTFSLRLEARIVGSVMVFWILEDFLWFALNPAFGIERLKPECVPWHKHWVLGIPVDYPVFLGIGLALMVGSFLFRRGTTRDAGAAALLKKAAEQ